MLLFLMAINGVSLCAGIFYVLLENIGVLRGTNLGRNTNANAAETW